MFRCRECQTEYEIKPDYCDCGNDTFDEILPEPPKPQKPQTVKQETVNEIKTTNSETTQKTFSQPEIHKTDTPKKSKPQVDIPSLVIFSICVLLSFIIIFFVGNPEENEVVNNETKPVKTAQNIPTNIDSFWNNKIPKVQPQNTSTQNYKPQQPQPPQQTQVQVQKQPLQQTQQPVKATSVANNTYSAPVKKTNITVQPKQTVKNQTTQTKSQTSSVAKNNSTQVAQQQTIVQQPKTVAQPKQTQPTVTKTTVTKTTDASTVNKQELANYKVALRNRIANNINFANVIGDGTCAVTFKVASSGAITNKKFVQQSDNFTLNDVVHSAVFNISSFNPPPGGYSGEMRLTVKMYNGNFSVSLN